MANTASIAALRQQLWDKELWADVIDGMFFTNKQMLGSGANFIVRAKDDLKKAKGDRVNFGLGAKLTGDGVTGDGELEGNEEKQNFFNDTILIDQIRNAVRLEGELDEQKSANDLRKEAKEKASIWLQEYLENQIFMKLGGVSTTTLQRVDSSVYSARAAWSNTPDAVPAADEAAGTGDRYLCADASGLDDIAATDILTTTLITRAKTKAMLANPKIKPLNIGGEKIYVMFIHPWQAADLKTASGSLWAQAQREAQLRGDKNPIFTGSLGMWDGVLLHGHEYVPTAQASSAFSVGGTTAAVRAFRALLCGQEACLMLNASKKGKGAAPGFMVERDFDYGNKAGFAAGYIGGFQKPTFNSKDYGVIALDTGATNIG